MHINHSVSASDSSSSPYFKGLKQLTLLGSSVVIALSKRLYEMSTCCIVWKPWDFFWRLNFLRDLMSLVANLNCCVPGTISWILMIFLPVWYIPWLFWKGRGTVVTGRIEQGIIKVGEEVEVLGLTQVHLSTSNWGNYLLLLSKHVNLIYFWIALVHTYLIIYFCRVAL